MKRMNLDLTWILNKLEYLTNTRLKRMDEKIQKLDTLSQSLDLT